MRNAATGRKTTRMSKSTSVLKATLMGQATLVGKSALVRKATLVGQATLPGKSALVGKSTFVRESTLVRKASVSNPAGMGMIAESMVPIGPPVVPPPAVPGEHADSNSQAERDSRSIDVGVRNPDPAWIHPEPVSVGIPGIIFRYVNEIRVCRLDHETLSVGRDVLLGRRLQIPGLLRSPAHHLNRVH
jgi:hypothetical protein